MALVYSRFDYIYPGPHMDDHGRFDERVWFFIPVGMDEGKGTITYLKFPAGAKDEEFVEEEVSVSSGSSWTD